MTEPIDRWFVIGLTVLAFAVLIIGTAVARNDHANAQPPTTQQTPRTCFPREAWNTGTVPAAKRPCAKIVRLYEDGSFKVRVSDADGTVRYSLGVGTPDR